jgi:hypothetical protein
MYWQLSAKSWPNWNSKLNSKLKLYFIASGGLGWFGSSRNQQNTTVYRRQRGPVFIHFNRILMVMVEKRIVICQSLLQAVDICYKCHHILCVIFASLWVCMEVHWTHVFWSQISKEVPSFITTNHNSCS